MFRYNNFRNAAPGEIEFQRMIGAMTIGSLPCRDDDIHRSKMRKSKVWVVV